MFGPREKKKNYPIPLWLIGFCGILAGGVMAQDAPPPGGTIKENEGAKTEPPPTLDELLGIEGEEESDAEDIAEKEAQAELERKLEEKAVGDAFQAALALMLVSADQLGREFDTGLGTQRIQEEILANLDNLLASAKKQKGQGSGSSSQSSQPSASKPNPGKQGQSGSKPGEQNRQGDAQEGDPPPMEQGSVNPVLDEERTEWGNLPQRVREMLLQGRREKFSSLYERLTREYYRRLAEED